MKLCEAVEKAINEGRRGVALEVDGRSFARYVVAFSRLWRQADQEIVLIQPLLDVDALTSDDWLATDDV